MRHIAVVRTDDDIDIQPVLNDMRPPAAWHWTHEFGQQACLELDGQAVAVPAGDVFDAAPLQHLVLHDDVFQHLRIDRDFISLIRTSCRRSMAQHRSTLAAGVTLRGSPS